MNKPEIAHRDDIAVCENCRFWQSKCEGDPKSKGECRLHPPVVVEDSSNHNLRPHWPEVESYHWCGDFEPEQLNTWQKAITKHGPIAYFEDGAVVLFRHNAFGEQQCDNVSCHLELVPSSCTKIRIPSYISYAPALTPGGPNDFGWRSIDGKLLVFYAAGRAFKVYEKDGLQQCTEIDLSAYSKVIKENKDVVENNQTDSG